MVELSALDAAVIALFVAAILALGFSAKLREHSALQFIAAGRSLTLPLFLATLVSTWYGGVLGIGESVQYYGLGTLLLLGCPYYLFALIYALIYARKVRNAEQISLPERLDRRFGKGPGLVGAILVFLLGLPAAHVLMLGVLTQALTGWSLGLSCVVALAAGTAFLWRGGLLADARMSILAFAMMYIGFAIITIWCLTHYPALETWKAIEPPEMLSFTGGQGLLTITTFFILGAWTLIDPGFHQRATSADSPKTAVKGILIAIGFWMLFDVMTVTTGLYAISLLETEITNPLLIFPVFGGQVLPPGLKALFLCGMAGTILSALVGYSLVSGASFGRDFVCRIKEGLDETKWTRIGIGAAAVAALFLGLKVDSVVALWYSWAGAAVGALLIPVSLAYLSGKSMSSGLIATSMIASFGVSAAWMFWGLSHDNLFLMTTLPSQVFGYNLPSGLADASFSLGTLLPGLVVSGLIIGLGQALGARRHERRDGSDAS
jgi:SSS family solute:Na+ symporter